MSPSEDRLPVIIGVGQVTNRVTEPVQSREPAQLLADAVRAAGDDAGLTVRLLAEVDSLDVVYLLAWSYADPCAEVAIRSGMSPSRTAYTTAAGDRPTVALDAAAARIAAGSDELAVVVGGEAMRSRGVFAKAGVEPPWSPQGVSPVLLDRTEGTKATARYGMENPSSAYAVLENAYRAARGRSHAAERARSARIWASNSQVAAKNPGAWFTEPRTPDEIATTGPSNRMISYPYPKLMCALMAVDQSAAVIVTSASRARRLGVPEERWIYVWGGAGASDSTEVIERPTYAESPAMARALHDTLDRTGLTPDDIDLFELYSCFPIVPKLAADVVGLGEVPGDRPWTVAGGLTFFGGPGNAYMSCATAAMVQALRTGEGKVGLLYGNGGYATKHHGLVLATAPSAGGYVADDRRRRQRELDAIPAPAIADVAEGPATVETWTVYYDRDGAPERGLVIGRLDDGRRFVANTPNDGSTLAALVDENAEPVGRRGVVRAGTNGNIFEEH
jgi:acetyl-CoA C-acetyltransferase